ncbi:M64 family metallopeptidase [Capnocytophaga sp. oral taxon 878]|uniref:M64 family metallopeptidase n=1 Tax=Capnocytophaga sp. oral taxon 878 TaxID=1316596 RepID=UPI000D03A867|nr:M64 family metallopeptidase [Capnocytophaga sp. oral taxon 878]AVM49233.1 peptidase [Capnocytophaga sp. oral taxon 878]
MKHLFLFFFLAFTLGATQHSVWGQQSPVFNFNNSLRIDFNLLTDAQHTEVLFQQLKKEPYWGGSHTNLISPNLGTLRLQLFDGNQLVYSKGFNSLSNEWAAIKEAKTEKRLFYHAMQVPFPLKPLTVHIDLRDHNGQFQTIAKQIINPNDYFIKEETPVSYPVKKLLHNGDAAKKVDLAILSEGYTSSQMDKFYADAQRMTDYMFTIPPFSQLKNDFNIYAIAVPSQESGTDVPGKNIYKNTAFHSSFYTFDQERYLTTNSLKEIADAAALVPYDQLYILVNTSTYGGGGFYNHLNLGTADHELSEKVYIHEFGHGFVGLADEYYYEWDPTFQDMYNLKIEPWEENITTLVDFGSKWKDMVKKKTPIPTPRIPKYLNEVGAFEGGGYLTKGMYSPVQDCRMKSNEPKGFCPVCERAIRRVVKFYTE